MKAENRGQRVRGFIVVGNRSTSLISKDNPDCIVAYTHWYRHDDNLRELDDDLNRLQRLYGSFNKTCSMSIGYEYKDYER